MMNGNVPNKKTCVKKSMKIQDKNSISWDTLMFINNFKNLYLITIERPLHIEVFKTSLSLVVSIFVAHLVTLDSSEIFKIVTEIDYCTFNNIENSRTLNSYKFVLKISLPQVSDLLTVPSRTSETYETLLSSMY